jgi:hypothetical protein
MTTTLYRRFAYVSAFAVALLSTPLAAQQSRGATTTPAGINTALASDVGTLSDKFVGLARVMAGKYDWKPGTGVRSVADVSESDRDGEQNAHRNADGRSRTGWRAGGDH